MPPLQESDESATVSHNEFVSGLRTGRITLQVDGPFAYPFAASRSSGFVWHITAWMNMLLTSPVVSVAIVVLAFILHDFRILLAVPAAILGPPGLSGWRSYSLPDFREASPEVRQAMLKVTRGHRFWTRLHQLLDVVALAGLCYTWFTFGWRSPWFLICAAYLVTFLECVIYHAIVQQAFLQMLLDSPDFYGEVNAKGVITVERVQP